jgi:hypothetical protein
VGAVLLEGADGKDQTWVFGEHVADLALGQLVECV